MSNRCIPSIFLDPILCKIPDAEWAPCSCLIVPRPPTAYNSSLFGTSTFDYFLCTSQFACNLRSLPTRYEFADCSNLTILTSVTRVFHATGDIIYTRALLPPQYLCVPLPEVMRLEKAETLHSLTHEAIMQHPATQRARCIEEEGLEMAESGISGNSEGEGSTPGPMNTGVFPHMGTPYLLACCNTTLFVLCVKQFRQQKSPEELRLPVYSVWQQLYEFLARKLMYGTLVRLQVFSKHHMLLDSYRWIIPSALPVVGISDGRL